MYPMIQQVIAAETVTCTTYFLTTQTGTWQQSKNLCQSLGLEMATVKNQAEKGLVNQNTYPNIWLGGRRDSVKFTHG